MYLPVIVIKYMYVWKLTEYIFSPSLFLFASFLPVLAIFALLLYSYHFFSYVLSLIILILINTTGLQCIYFVVWSDRASGVSILAIFRGSMLILYKTNGIGQKYTNTKSFKYFYININHYLGTVIFLNLKPYIS